MSHTVVTGWLLLFPQIPPQPSSLRVRVWRRLQQIGAVAVKNATYALRDTRLAVDQRRGMPLVSIPLTVSTPELQPGQLWVTRAGVYVDRLACAWMLQRFVDPEARFLFVAPDAGIPGEGIPYDIAGA